MTEYIRGYRIQADRKPEKQFSTSYLALKSEASKALSRLRFKVNEEQLKYERGEGKGVPCRINPKGFSDDDLMSDRDAQLACAGCPAFRECEIYRILGSPPHGIHAGVRKNMEIPDD